LAHPSYDVLSLTLVGAMDRLVGRALGPYELEELLGSGGWGAVYRGLHRRLGLPRAVKVLPSQLAPDADFLRRFEREAHLAASLRHPNIVQIHDIAEADGFHFIAMELVEGVPLRRLIQDEGPLPIGRALRLLDQLADALDYAHARGVLHRDLKPAKVLVGPDDRVTLVDFGLARGVEGARLTRSGVVLGTPEYLAPEAVEGYGSRPNADLYALGAMAHEMFAGQPPFGGDNTLGVLCAQVHVPPPPLRSLRRGLPESIEAAVLRQLAKDPARRYPSARSFAVALHGDLEEAPARAHPPIALPTRRSSIGRRYNLPAEPTPMVGRERELGTARKLLRGDVRLLTLTGPGGIFRGAQPALPPAGPGGRRGAGRGHAGAEPREDLTGRD
jgi:serine/threonine-protein kinase